MKIKTKHIKTYRMQQAEFKRRFISAKTVLKGKFIAVKHLY